MDDKRGMLRHFLATLVYRTQKALRGAPTDFGSFVPCDGVRSPAAQIRHMTSVLGYARTFFIGGRYSPEPLQSLEAEVARFHEIVADLARCIDSDAPLSVSPEQLLQGPLADALTHAGQIALLRRLAGSPVRPENFVYAAIDPQKLGSEQASPIEPDEIWPEAPSDWVPPSRRSD